MTPMETIGLVMEKMRKIVSRVIGAPAAGSCLPSASNHPIWPPLATMMVAPGMVPLSISRWETADIRCRRDEDSPSDSGFPCGKGGVWGLRAGLVADCADMTIFPLCLFYCRCRVSLTLAQPCREAETGVEDAIGRFALAIRPCAMLETARNGGTAAFPQECSSIGRAPVSKTGGRRFEPCHSCQRDQRVGWHKLRTRSRPKGPRSTVDSRPSVEGAAIDALLFRQRVLFCTAALEPQENRERKAFASNCSSSALSGSSSHNDGVL